MLRAAKGFRLFLRNKLDHRGFVCVTAAHSMMRKWLCEAVMSKERFLAKKGSIVVTLQGIC